jgi:hypothetical protein
MSRLRWWWLLLVNLGVRLQMVECLEYSLHELILSGYVLLYLRVVGLVGLCHTPFRERGNEASIRVPRMFKSHV